jgi:hypothetical protein
MSASIAACHSGSADSFFQIGYVGRRVLQRQQLPAIRQRDRIIEAGAPGH